MIGPLILLADSQLLFASRRVAGFLDWLRFRVAGRRGVYLGASNGDEEVFYQLACEAITAIGGSLDWQRATDFALSDAYDFYLLAGGDVAQGWRYIGETDVFNALERARHRGAMMIGVSAGAMHLASAIWPGAAQAQRYLGWCDVAVAVHEEGEGWPTLTAWQQLQKSARSALLCIPMGAGLVWDDGQAYSVGHGVEWFETDGTQRKLLPLSLRYGEKTLTTRSRGEPNV